MGKNKLAVGFGLLAALTCAVNGPGFAGSWIGPDGEWQSDTRINAHEEWETAYAIAANGEWAARALAAKVPDVGQERATANGCASTDAPTTSLDGLRFEIIPDPPQLTPEESRKLDPRLKFAFMTSKDPNQIYAVAIKLDQGANGVMLKRIKRALGTAGVKIVADIGTIVTARARQAGIEKAIAIPGVRYIEGGRQLRP